MEYDDRTAAALVLLLSGAIVALAIYPEPLWADMPYLTDEQETERPGVTPDRVPMVEREPAHKHQRLFFLIEGERKNLSDAYIEIEPWGHFHHDDGIFHQEVRPLHIDEALASIDVTVNDGCLTFGLEDREHCANETHEIGIVINGAYHDPADVLDRELEQGDRIVVFYGDPEDPAIGDYAERELPEEYRPDFDGV